MGFPPPPDGPTPDDSIATAELEQTSVLDICGFKIPLFIPKFGFNIPSISFPPPLPTFSFAIGINCVTDNPIDVSSNVEYGGGRQIRRDPDQDFIDNAA